MELHAEILKKNGENQFAILPYEEFLAVQALLADAEDLLELRKAKKAESRKTGGSLSGGQAATRDKVSELIVARKNPGPQTVKAIKDGRRGQSRAALARVITAAGARLESSDQEAVKR